jgi:hypothetical protein
MKRRNVEMAFVGEGLTSDNTSPDQLVQGEEAIDIAVVRGKVQIVVPATTPDGEIFEAASIVGGELLLENGVCLSFEINGDAVGAQYSATADGKRADTHEGLSSLPDVPGGA